jgi:asparagine synthase (glutamine-hydrolysing)
MSVQFGRWNFDGKPVDRDYLEKAKGSIAPYGPDNTGSYSKSNINILYHAFHTTKESRHETQPHITESGAVVTWDGRLDNRAELIRSLRDVLTISSTDVSIVAEAYKKWGKDCFAKLIGDWALSIWDANTRSLILAKDPVGTRHLYYSIDNEQLTWSTILDPLVLFAGKTFALCEEYVAGWLSFFPAAHLTPYVGIHSVPPSSSVLILPGRHYVSKYWDFDGDKRIRYRTDSEYEEHFRSVFREAVRRRLRSDTPILAELSGGMDSSSIVCMADTIIARGAGETPRLDTVSYFDDSEPSWNELPYFTSVEEKRGRTGCHIQINSHESFDLAFDCDRLAATPCSAAYLPKKASRQFASCIASQGNRVVLSGTGGDEVTGGVPTPTPELADLLARGQFRRLAHQLKLWALNKRRPWFHLFLEAARGFFPSAIVGVPKRRRPAPWLDPAFVERNRAALRGYERRLKLFGPLPTFQENVSTLAGLQGQLACDGLPDPPYEKRYPYLDRSVLEFIYAIPREQLVRPGQRRSLTRRALAGIVPDELLNRKRKAFVVRGPMVGIGVHWMDLIELTEHMLASEFGIVDSASFASVLRQARKGQQVPLVRLFRTLLVECWIRNLNAYGILLDRTPCGFVSLTGSSTKATGTSLTLFEGIRGPEKDHAIRRKATKCINP